MPLVRACSIGEIPEGRMLPVRVAGRDVAICRVEEAVYAISGVCPHRDGPLAHGALHGHMAVCPWHAWEFDCRTGQHDYNPEIKVQTYPVTLRGEDVLVEVE